MPDSIPALSRRAIWFGPVRCDDVSKDELVAELAKTGSGGPRLIFNLNAHALNLVLGEPALADVFNASHLTFCDGFGIVVLGKLLGVGAIENRNTPPDFVEEVYQQLHAGGGTVFFLGDEPATVQAYARSVERRWPGLAAGWESGFFEVGGVEDSAIIQKINTSGASLLLLGMGMPRQECWAVRHAAELRCDHVLSVGALFAWGGGRRRGPRWATDHGLEWLFRLVNEPGRVWKRYLIGLPQVAWRLVRHRAFRKTRANS